jgi:hypothetical protein
MKRIMLFLNIFTLSALKLPVIVFIFIFLAIGGTDAIAGNTVTYEGTIQGLDCVHYKRNCPEDDLSMYIALEKDFVLLSPTGSHYLLPNLDRHIKIRYLTKPVRIRGELKGDSIWVNILEAKEGEHFKPVWSWEEQRKVEEAH